MIDMAVIQLIRDLDSKVAAQRSELAEVQIALFEFTYSDRSTSDAARRAKAAIVSLRARIKALEDQAKSPAK